MADSLPAGQRVVNAGAALRGLDRQGIVGKVPLMWAGGSADVGWWQG